LSQTSQADSQSTGVGKPQIYLSIVIPVYNEEKRISATLDKLLAYLSGQPWSREIVLVDDGSVDGGIGLARRRLEDAGEVCRVISYGANRGKGYALKQGMLASQGRYALFTDADLSTPIEELDKILPWFEQGYDIVQGSRKMPGAAVERHQPWLRENMGKVFTWLSNFIARVDVRDVTCGFKCYRAEVAHDLYGRQQIYDWSFDAEIIYIARLSHYKLKEVPVRWFDERGTKVHLVKDSVRSFWGLLTIRMNGFKGLYNRPAGASTATQSDSRVS
jgi:dolichyl-phosphate beta-glucosyltransferase